MRIIIPGGSGQIGHVLARHLSAQGHAVTVLSRHPQPAPWRTISWDTRTPGAPNDSWIDELEGADVCINLSGRSVDCRYTPENRRLIHDSRTVSTRLLNQVISSLQHPPRVWLNAATATIYRHALDRAQDEATGEFGGNEPGAPDTWNFSIQVAKDWEAAFFETQTPRTRKVALRSSMTFSPDPGGVFDVFLKLVRLGLGGKEGDGRQFVSWIHDLDFARAIDLLIAREDLSGPVNLASPNPLPNAEFLRVLRDAWRTPVGLPSNRWMIEIGTFLLRTESELVLKSRHVIPTRLLEAGFHFQYPTWPEAAQDLVQRWVAQRKMASPNSRKVSF